MKKITIILGSSLIGLASIVNAHPIPADFQSSSWNWNNGSHIVVDGDSISMSSSSTTNSKTKHKNTNAMDKIDKMDKRNTKKNAVATSKANKQSKTVPMYDMGMKPASSK